MKSSSLWIAGICAIAAVLLFWAGFAFARGGTLAVAVLFLAFALAWLRESVWVFDPERGMARWNRMRFFTVSSGEIAFSEISEAVIQSSASDRGGAATYRLALRTSHGEIPLFDAYSGDQARYVEVRDAIERALCAQRVSSTAGAGELGRET